MTAPKKGVAVFFGAIRVTIDGVVKDFRRALVIDFGDTESLRQTVNSGFGEFEPFDDDTMAVVLDGKPPAVGP